MAKITGSVSKNGYGFYAVLTETLGENYLSTNTTKVKYEVYIQNGNVRTESNNWTFNAKIDGSNVYNETGQTLKTNDTDYNKAKLLFSGTKDIKHGTDGTKTITFSSTLSRSTYSSYDPGKCTLSGSFKLTDIPRASSLTTGSTFVNFGGSVKIDIGRNVNTYTDTITWVGYYPKDNGDGSYSLQNGEPSNVKGTIAEKTNVAYVDWLIPEELSTLIPTLRMVGVKLTCTTYNGDTIIGTTEKWLSAMLVEENAKPLITKSVIETNQKVINQLGTNNFSMPVLNVSQPQFTFSATPRYNATIKSLKITCDDGQTGTISPHTFKPIGSAKFSIVAVDSRDYTTTIPIDLSASSIPYVIPTIKSLEVDRISPTSGEIIINAHGSWYGGTMIDDIANPLYTDYKCKIRDENGDANLITIPKSAVRLYEATNQWYIEDYSLGSITQYNKNYDFTLIIGDYYYTEIQLSKLIRKGVPTFDYGEHDLKVNGDLFVADENGLNKVNILKKIGILTNLTTNEKTSLVNAINEINNKATNDVMTIDLSANTDYALSTTWSTTKIGFNQVTSIGNRLTFANNLISIGSNVKKIKVSMNALTRGIKGIQTLSIMKNGASIKQAYYTGANTGDWESSSITPFLVNVEEGDTIGLNVGVGGVTGTIQVAGGTFLTAEVIE